MIAGALGALLGLATPSTAQLRPRVHLSGLSNPVGFVQDPSDPAVQYVVEQNGVIKVVLNGAVQAAPFLNISASIAAGGERGLLGLAFPPNYGTSGRFYVLYTRSGDGYIVVARFKRSANRLIADEASSFPLKWSTGDTFIVHPHANHNAGCLQFGPDGMLYIASGDGGSGNDPANYAQDPDSLLGKMLRIDVSSVSESHPDGFVVPAGNAGLPRPEIWSLGWRNPWRFSFDMGAGGTGAMVVGDVGQGAREEIDYEPANRPGRNYGWRYREGLISNPNGGTPPVGFTYTNPVFDYDRSLGACVTGGYVYRGSHIPSLRGRYFFADYVMNRIWSIALMLDGNGEATASGFIDHTSELGGAGPTSGISSFGVDSLGELYLVDHRMGSIISLTRNPVRPPTNVRIIR